MNNLADGRRRECCEPDCHQDRLRGRKYCEEHLPSGDNENSGFPPHHGQEIWIYFLGVEGDDVIKIGRTCKEDVTERANEIQQLHYREILILAYIKLPYQAEGWIHKALRQHRIRGEWFRRNAATEKVIAAAKTQNPNTFYGVFGDL